MDNGSGFARRLQGVPKPNRDELSALRRQTPINSACPISSAVVLASGSSVLSVWLYRDSQSIIRPSWDNNGRQADGLVDPDSNLFTFRHWDYKVAGTTETQISDPTQSKLLASLLHYVGPNTSSNGFMLWINRCQAGGQRPDKVEHPSQ